MIVEVHHVTEGVRVHVATVNVPHDDLEDALEYAFRWTQNIQDSWSMPVGNLMDRNARVTVHAALPVHKGKTYGLRSSMVGDLLVVDDERTWRVDPFGFKEVTANAAAHTDF